MNAIPSYKFTGNKELETKFIAYKEGLKKKIVKANEELKEIKYEFKTNWRRFMTDDLPFTVKEKAEPLFTSRLHRFSQIINMDNQWFKFTQCYSVSSVVSFDTPLVLITVRS